MSQLPTELLNSIEKVIHKKYPHYSHPDLLQAYQNLQQNYQALKTDIELLQKPCISSEIERIAYLLMRMPATYAVAKKIFAILFALNFSTQIKTVLDLGCGMGSVLWALHDYPLQAITAVDQDAENIALARAVAVESGEPGWQQVNWQKVDIQQPLTLKPHDLVTLSYVLIEQPDDLIPDILRQAWSLTQQALVIIEPGTPAGFANCLLARDFFIKQGAFIAAPCSHQGACPLQKDWCHFSERIERSFWQKTLKQATVGYEDETYSYLIATKKPLEIKSKRILRPPRKHSGHLTLELCAPDVVEKITISRRQKDLYQKAKKLRWGEVLDLD